MKVPQKQVGGTIWVLFFSIGFQDLKNFETKNPKKISQTSNNCEEGLTHIF